MSLQKEVEAVGTLIKDVVPDVEVRYEVPTTPTHDTLVVRFQASSTESETRYHYRDDRTFQIVVYGEDTLDCITKMDIIDSAVMGGDLTINVGDSPNSLRIESFAYSDTFRTESGLFGSIGMLEAIIRKARTQPHYDKIGVVNASVE